MSVEAPQFNADQRTQALDLMESLAWGDMEYSIRNMEIYLALALEATGDAIELWEHEDEGEERFGGEFYLSEEQVAELDDEWRLAYIARLLLSALIVYGVSPGTRPGRPGRERTSVTPPADWEERSSTPARLLRGLNDILRGLFPVGGRP